MTLLSPTNTLAALAKEVPTRDPPALPLLLRRVEPRTVSVPPHALQRTLNLFHESQRHASRR